MGVYGRDYMRDSGSGSNWTGSGGATGAWPPACKWILIANIVVFLAQTFTILPNGGHGIVTSTLSLYTSDVLSGKIWQIVTSGFCHANIMHILVNMLVLVFFGRPMERMYGTREFTLFYFVAIVFASLAFIGLDLAVDRRASAYGASGATMAVFMLFAWHYPRQKILLFLFIPVEIRWALVGYVIYDLMPVITELTGGKDNSGVAHAAHLGGLAWGFLYAKNGLRVSGWVDRIYKSKPAKKKKKVRAKQKPAGEKIVPMDPIESKVDELLAKIKANGKDSLTDNEKEFLERASQHYRDRDK